MKRLLLAFAILTLSPLILTSQSPTTQPRLQQSDLAYLGAFRLPADGSITGDTFSYGGRAISYYAPNNSLYVSGARASDYITRMAEVGIPTVTTSGTVAGLNTASVLQNFHDATEYYYTLMNPDPTSYMVLSASLPYHNKLLQGLYVFYDNSNSAYLSHITSGLDLSVTGDVNGPYSISPHYVSFVGGYMAIVPPEWVSLIGAPAVAGNCCLSIVSRTSYGLSLFGFDPDDFGVHEPTPGVDLFYYTAAHEMPGATDNAQNNYWTLATQVTGVVFPTGTRSVLFFGRHGTGPYCYGEVGAPEFCGDTTVTSRGPHAQPYHEYVWAYDANDLVAAKNGSINLYDVAPYAVWSLDLPYTYNYNILGAAYDPVGQRIFVSQEGADSTHPIIQVYKVNNVYVPGTALHMFWWLKF